MNANHAPPLPGASMLEPMGGEPARSDPTAKKSSRSKDRFSEINGFVDVTLQGLTRAELVVWLILWRDTKPNGVARTSQADLAKRGGISLRMVQYALQSLQELDLLKVVHRGRIGKGCSTYRVRGSTG